MSETPPRPTSLSPMYNFCSAENIVCNPGEGTYSVAYASANGKIHYRNTTSNSIMCNNEIFGDPDPNIPKTCWAMKVGEIPFTNEGHPENYQFCAKQGDICRTDDGTNRNILYGADGRYVAINANSVKCDSDVLGDPSPGKPKSCYYLN